DQRLALGFDDLVDGFLAALALTHVGRQEDIADGVAALFRQGLAELGGDDIGEKLVRQGGENAATVTGICFAAAAAAAIHHAQGVIRFDNDAVAGATLHVGHEADTATFLFIGGVVQAVSLGQSPCGVFVHRCHSGLQLLKFATRLQRCHRNATAINRLGAGLAAKTRAVEIPTDFFRFPSLVYPTSIYLV